MQTFGVACLGHNIPSRLRAGASVMCAVRVANTRDETVHFQSHASFYATPRRDWPAPRLRTSRGVSFRLQLQPQ